MKTWKLTIVVTIIGIAVTTRGQAQSQIKNKIQNPTISKMSLEEFLKISQERNHRYLSAEQSVQAAKNKIGAAGLDLEPSLNLQYLKASDESQPNAQGKKVELEQKSISLSKKFKTGTSLTLSTGINDYAITAPAVSSPAPGGPTRRASGTDRVRWRSS